MYCYRSKPFARIRVPDGEYFACAIARKGCVWLTVTAPRRPGVLAVAVALRLTSGDARPAKPIVGLAGLDPMPTLGSGTAGRLGKALRGSNTEKRKTQVQTSLRQQKAPAINMKQLYGVFCALSEW